MKVTNAHLRIAILVLGAILILYGLLKILFKVNLGPAIEQNLPTVVMVGAAAIFVWNRQIYARDKTERDEAEAKKAEEQKDTDENSSGPAT